ncbi:MAG: hypothetical protein ACREQ5_29995, partial [Candidatus Dormibacteria bacterium]
MYEVVQGEALAPGGPLGRPTTPRLRRPAEGDRTERLPAGRGPEGCQERARAPVQGEKEGPHPFRHCPQQEQLEGHAPVDQPVWHGPPSI